MPSDKPSVLLILADDIGLFDVSADYRGIMGTTTPTFDRIGPRR
jgi:arylsulfatase